MDIKHRTPRKHHIQIAKLEDRVTWKRAETPSNQRLSGLRRADYYYRCGADFVTLQLTEQSERNAQNLADNANAYIGGRPAILHAARPAAGGLSLTAAWERDGLDFWATIESPTAQDEDILAEMLGGVTAIRGAGPRTP